MVRLNRDRLTAVRPILARFGDKLRRDGSFSAPALERELSDALRLGYQELTALMVDLFEDAEHRLTAAYYMENVNPDTISPPDTAPHPPGIAPEFHEPLARLYGIATYDSPEREQARESFWRRALAEEVARSASDPEYEGPRFTAHDEAGRDYVLIPVYYGRTDPSGHPAGGGYEPADLVRLRTATGNSVRRDGPGRYTLLDSCSRTEIHLTSNHDKAV